jgi:outer membrane protein OmpA-like peptidoglycan-associated protein
MSLMRNITMDGRRRPLVSALALLAVFTLVLSGCKNGNRVSIDDLQAENAELRDRNDQIESALNDSESARASLESERDGLLGENQRLRGDIDGMSTITGFEGIAGSSVDTRTGEIAVSVEGDVLFNSGVVTLKSGAKTTLDQIASVIKSDYAGHEIRIAGHTDTDKIKKSKWGTNERLSAERALAVEEYLAGKGISKDKMYVAAYGPAKKKGTKKASRRVEIVILR